MTADILIVPAILLGVAILIILGIVRIDIAALIVMITLTRTGVITAEEVFSGLSSSARLSQLWYWDIGWRPRARSNDSASKS